MTAKRLPQHIAIIMDGNGRWAQKRGLGRSEGHTAGVETVRKIVDAAAAMGVKCLTLYAFSTENWLRPSAEVDNLMALFAESLIRYGDELHRNGVRLRAIGDTDRLPEDARQRLFDVLKKTESNDRMTLVIALSYSSRVEIGRAVAQFVKTREFSGDTSPIDPYCYPLEPFLETAGLPDLDLLIRTGGEQRLSNFLLYQAAYAELYFTDCLWPDFDEQSLKDAIDVYMLRERRYGKVLDNEHDWHVSKD